MNLNSPHSAAPPLEDLRHDWTDEEILAVHDLPIPELIFRAQGVHRRHHDPTRVQLCTLLSIKTGSCPEDCAYCAQSGHYSTHVEPEGLIDVERVVAAARRAKESGSTRLCMGAAWREPRNERDFRRVLEMVREVRSVGLEACCTLGMLSPEQASELAEAGLTAYNHNLDTGPDYYARIVSTHSFEDRIQTIRNVQQAGIEVCSGGILGMGESLRDRVAFLGALSRLEPHPGSVPINALVPVAGTPLERRARVDPIELVRMVATARIVCPRSRVRLSAGRLELSDEAQALCFVAGANSIFVGEKLLTTPNPQDERDRTLFEKLGLQAMGE